MSYGHFSFTTHRISFVNEDLLRYKQTAVIAHRAHKSEHSKCIFTYFEQLESIARLRNRSFARNLISILHLSLCLSSSLTSFRFVQSQVLQIYLFIYIIWFSLCFCTIGFNMLLIPYRVNKSNLFCLLLLLLLSIQISWCKIRLSVFTSCTMN